jgi:hypothetical protein
LTLFFSFSSSRNHSSPSSTDIYTFICVTKPLKSFPICFRFCALPAFQSLKSKLLDPPGFAPRFRFSSFEASNSILTFHVFRGIEFYFEEEKHFCFSIRLSYSASIKTDSSVCITRKKQGENSDKKERNYIISDYFFPRLTPTLLLRVPVNLHEFSSPIYSLSQKHTILSFKYSLSLSLSLIYTRTQTHFILFLSCINFFPLTGFLSLKSRRLFQETVANKSRITLKHNTQTLTVWKRQKES